MEEKEKKEREKRDNSDPKEGKQLHGKELYNLDNDPLEQHPLGEDHEMHKKLFRELQLHIMDAGAVPWQKGQR